MTIHRPRKPLLFWFPLVAWACLTTCSRDPLPTSGASEPPTSVRLSLGVPPGAPPELAKVKLSLKSEAGIVQSRTVALEDHGRPAPDPLAGHAFADHLFLVTAGSSYDAYAELLDAREVALKDCRVNPARTGVVVPGTTTEVPLVATCGRAQAGVDVSVTINNLPWFSKLDIPGGKYLCVGETAAITAEAQDPDGDPVSVSWAAEATGGATAADFCLGSNGGTASLEPAKPGRYQMKVTATDSHGASQSVTFPLFASECARPASCPGQLVRSSVPWPVTEQGSCACLAEPYRPRFAEPLPGKITGTQVRPPYLRNSRSLVLERWFFEPAEACPASGHWKPDALFTWSGRRSLRAHCRYYWDRDSEPDYAALAMAPIKPPGDDPDHPGRPPRLACDQPLMNGHQDAGTPPAPAPFCDRLAVQSSLRTNFFKRLTFDREYGRHHSLQPSRVRVAVIDSAVFDYGVEDRQETFGHGRLVGRIIADLSCPDADPKNPDCQKRIKNYLALDWESPDRPPNRERGGFYGDVSTLAQQIHQALDDWTKEPAGEPLVINLSVGWERRHEEPGYLPSLQLDAGAGDCPSTDTSLLRESVRTALERASCLGALVVAAAGNADIEDDVVDRKPVYPAAWEEVKAPSGTECERYVPSGWVSRTGGVATYQPLVYAASGIGTRFGVRNVPAALANTRADGFAMMTGPGLAVTCDTRSSDGLTEVMSGSSFGAAALSGTAAAVWGLDTGKGAHDVMKVIRDHGSQVNDLVEPTLITSRADFCLPESRMDGRCPTSTLLSHCRALRALPRAGSLDPNRCDSSSITSRDPIEAEPEFRLEAEPFPPSRPFPDWDDPARNRNGPVWAQNFAAWVRVRPTPEPTKCPPPICKLKFQPANGLLVFEGTFRQHPDLSANAVVDQIQLTVRALEQEAGGHWFIRTGSEEMRRARAGTQLILGLGGAPMNAAMAKLTYAFTPGSGVITRIETVFPDQE